MKEKNSSTYIINIIMSVLVFLSATIFLIYNILKMNNEINGFTLVISSSILELFSIIYLITSILKGKIKNVFNIFAGLVFIGYILFNILTYNGILKINEQEMVKNFINQNISEAIIYGQEKDIEIEYTYEFSDNIEENIIISQDILPNELIKNIKKLVFVVSSGPNYDKELILTNLEGSTIDEVLEIINENFLNNVEINYEINNEIAKDTVISQSVKGNIKRNTKVIFNISLGNSDSLIPFEMENYENKSLFDITLFLKRNGVKYEISYDYSDTVKKDYVISHNPNSGTIDPKSDTVKIVISYGAKVIVPNLKEMSITDIVKWANENNIKITFKEEYHTTYQLGEIISVSKNKDDVISDGTTIVITTSKGSLKLIDTSNLTEFKTWADSYGIKYVIKYDYSDTVIKGKIISFSQNINTVVDLEKDITVTVSNGKPITVPNFVGKTKSTITSTCNNLGLNCTFYYTGYSSTAKDIATKQNVKANTIVVNGTYVSIGLSSGPAKTYTVYIQSEWLGNTADATITTLKSKLTSAAPGVTFNFVKKSSNTGARSGLIHESSPIKGGNNNFTQGNTYTIWIIQ